MGKPILVVGAGGFARGTLDVIEAINVYADTPIWEVLGVVDDNPSLDNRERLSRRGVNILGSIKDALVWKNPTNYVVGIGNPPLRRAIVSRLDEADWRAATLIHPLATVGSDCRIGTGTVIYPGARINTNVDLGRHVHINFNATVGHDSILGDFVSINPLAAISGDCVIEDEVLVGVSGVVLNGLRVGREATVGGCACVVRDVHPTAVVKGVPAR